MKSQKSNIAKFREQVTKAQAEGYYPMPKHYTDKHGNGNGFDFESVLNAAMAQANGDNNPSILAGNTPQQLCVPPSADGNEISVPEGIGTPKLGYIEWGFGNNLPNTISKLTSLLPYPATAVKFNVDVAAGMGFVPKYPFTEISNGSLVTKKIDYADAGKLLEQQLIDARLALVKFYNDYPQEDSNSITVPSAAAVGPNSALPFSNEDKKTKQIKELETAYLNRIANAEEAYKNWQQSNTEVVAFIAHNNLPLLAINLFNDMILYNLCFPEIELSQNTTEQPDTAQWEPKATGIAYRDAHTCRMEKMDNQNNINFIYHSNRWLDQPQIANKLSPNDIVAIPAIDPEHPTDSLNQKLRDFRIKNPKAKPAERPTRFIFPSSIPTSGRKYYPQPSWHSIFGGDIYAFLATIVSDRYIRRKNKNIIGHIIYVHQAYVNQLMLQKQQEVSLIAGRKDGKNLTQQEKQEVLDAMWKEINSFLSNHNNAGQPLLSFTFQLDGKDHDAFRIIDIPNTTANDANAQKTELEEISAIVFFALQCHPELIGAVPGRTGAGGGTYQRELYLLKQVQMASTQQIVLRVLDTIAQFNHWYNLKWDIRQQVLTTLDNSKTGLTDSQSS